MMVRSYLKVCLMARFTTICLVLGALLLHPSSLFCQGEDSNGASCNSDCVAWAAYRVPYRVPQSYDIGQIARMFNVTASNPRISNSTIQFENGTQAPSSSISGNESFVLRIPIYCQCPMNNILSDDDNPTGTVALINYHSSSSGMKPEDVSKEFGFLSSASSIATMNGVDSSGNLNHTDVMVAIPCKCRKEGELDPMVFITYVTPNAVSTTLKDVVTIYKSSETLMKQCYPAFIQGGLPPNKTIFIPLNVADREQEVSSMNSNAKNAGNTSQDPAAAVDQSNKKGRSSDPQPRATFVVLVVGIIVGFLAITLLVFVGIVALCGASWTSSTGTARQDSFDICCHLVKSTDSEKDKEEKEQRLQAVPSIRMGIDLGPADNEKSRLFCFKDLAAATGNFSDRNKIGDGGYCTVYRGLINGKPRAIKKMVGSANREFQLELQVLTKVHHIHLVELVGHCVENGLYLVYDYMPNGTLGQHLHNPSVHGFKPLRWSERVQIALDSARALEYIHEHTSPRYVHRDIKSNNILLDKNMRAKVADFGLTKLIRENSEGNSQTRLVGTFGYMAPEYARFGEISTKVDVYAFGVVLLEIISGKEAIVQKDATGLNGTIISVMGPVWREPNGRERLPALVDPSVRDLVVLEDVYKLVVLAGKCTDEDPEKRPSMRTVVMALMTLSSTSTEWEAGFDADITFAGLLNGR